MSAPMVLTADQLDNVAQFLRALTIATREHGVELAPYGGGALQVGETTIGFEWRDDHGYVLADQVGS